MTHLPYLPRTCVDLSRIRANYRLLAERLGSIQFPEPLVAPAGARQKERALPPFWQPLMPVVKADAYGHGRMPVALALREEGAVWFASGSVQEAILLRQDFEAHAVPREQAGIVSMLGLVEPGDASLCAIHDIVPMLYDKEQLRLLESEPSLARAPLPVAVKCNSGMSRLGFNEDEIQPLRERLRRLPLWPVLAVSHLHSADMEDGRAQAQAQARVFARFLAALREDWPGLAASLGNSAGALLADAVTPLIGAHVCRPGLALYGYNPFYGTSLAPLGQGLSPAMSVHAPIISTRMLAAGDGIGYCHAYFAPRDMPVGIIGAGYSDCYARSLSNKGMCCVAGVRAPIIGRVAMQMTAVDLSAVYENARTPSPPRTAWLLGGPYAQGVSPEELAALWGTIPYEVLLLLGHNAKVYGPYPEQDPPRDDTVQGS